MSIIQGNAHTSAGGYQIERSLRFNSADSAYLNRTPASSGNRRTFTWSGWVKRSALGESNLFSADTATGNTGYTAVVFNSTDNLQLQVREAGVNRFVTTSSVYRDVSSWYHVVIAMDTTQATAANRRKMYVNGVEITAFGTSNDITQNFDTSVNNTVAQQLGVSRTSGSGFEAYNNGYLTEINFIDGQALTPSSFGETDSNTGVWKPKAFSGTYGTNGFYLKFADNSNTTAATLGKDSSGNGNNWTPNNFSVTAGAGNDSLVDSPTSYGTDTGVGGTVRGNYATLNPLDKGSNLSTVDGNLQVNTTTGSWNTIRSTIGITSGKFYWEFYATNTANAMGGITTSAASISNYIGSDAYGWSYNEGDGNKYNNGSGSAYGATYTTNDIIGVAFDADNGTLTFYKNNSSQGTAFTGLTSGPYFPAFAVNNSLGVNIVANFGQRAFAYTAPSGFKALCTQNLPTPTIGATSTTQANDYFDVKTYTGDGTSPKQVVTGLGFQPDLIWSKDRNLGAFSVLYDAVRGVGSNKALSSGTTDPEGLGTTAGSPATFGYISSINSDGYTATSGSTNNNYHNANAGTYVSWNWKANGAGSSNTAGTITSTVSANTTSGFSIVTYTAPASGNFTVGHGLGVAPKMIITKRRDSASQWWVWHISLGDNTTDYLSLNTTNAETSSANMWGTVGRDSSVMGYNSGVSVVGGSTQVAYCFAPVAGYSAFGSYTGNGSADGPFVYVGFRPRFVLIKDTSSGNWRIYDTARDSYNVSTAKLYPSSSVAENGVSGESASTNTLDVLSNGFKLRTSNSETNFSSNTYIYAAFGDAFKYSLAR